MRDNEKYFPQTTITQKAMAGVREAQKFNDVIDKLAKAQEPLPQNIYAAFEPFSPIIIERIRAIRDVKQKNALYNDILNDTRAELLYETKEAKTTIYPNHRGKKSKSWEQTKEMARNLNSHGSSVCFLPEYKDVSSADAIVQFRKRWTIADFKYSTTANYNTIAEDLIKGFSQAKCVVLQMTNGDAGTFRAIIEQMQRKGCKIGDIVLINKYGKVVELNKDDLLSGKYMKKIRGKL